MVTTIKALSATGIKDFLQCKLKIIFRYDREIKRMTNDHAKVGSAVHEALEQFTRRMLSKKSFPDASDYDFTVTCFMNAATDAGLENMGFYRDGKNMVTEFIDRYDPSEEIIDVEHRFKLETPEGIPIVGAMDKVVKINDDTIAIIDYKTARNALNMWELQDDVQLSMYDYAASLIWPEYKNRLLFLDYVRINKKVSTYRTDEDRETFSQFLSSVWLQMQKLEEEEVKGSLNSLCGWCDYHDYCPVYTEFLTSKDTELEPIPLMSSDAFIEHWDSISVKKSILENRQRELKMVATKKFMEGSDIKAGGREFYSSQAARTTYDVEKVIELLPKEDLFSVLAVNKGKLDRYAKDDPDLRDKLGRIASVNYNAPTYRTREVKEGGLDDFNIGQDQKTA